jgi:hypothetical protein
MVCFVHEKISDEQRQQKVTRTRTSGKRIREQNGENDDAHRK